MHLGYVQFQELVEGFNFLPEIKRKRLLYQVFPECLPINFSDQPDFNGIKTFNYDNKLLFISRFFYRGKKDRSGRALLEACVLSVDFKEFNKYYRDVELIVNLLDQMANKGVLDKNLFLKELYGKNIFSDERKFLEFIGLVRKYGSSFLSQILGAVIDRKRLIILHKEQDYTIMKIIFILLPKKILYKLSTSTVCTNPDEKYRENIVVTSVYPEKTSEPVVDLNSKSIRNGSKNELIEFVLEELVSGSWFGFSQIELFNFLVDYLDHAITKMSNPVEVSEKLRAMVATVAKAEKLYKLLKKNWKKLSKI